MYKNKNTILIVYPKGGSGTFLEWALRYLIGEEKEFTIPVWPDIIDWHTWQGIYKGNPIDFPANFYPLSEKITIDNYLESSIEYTVARSGLKELSAQEFVDKYSLFFKKILILSDSESEINGIYNTIRRDQFKGKNVLDRLYNNVRPTDQYWEIREKISFNLSSYLFSDQWKVNKGNFLIVNIKDILEYPEQTVRNLCSNLNLKVDEDNSKNFSEKVLFWQQNQIFRHKDKVCRKIVDSVVKNYFFNWSNEQLLILDESFIQMLLRDLHGLELRCYNVNVFPKNSTELRDIIV